MEITQGPIKRVEKVWGEEIWHVNNELYCHKTLVVKPRGSSSLHYHTNKDEAWIVEVGPVHIEINKERAILISGQSVRIRAKDIHKFWNVSRLNNLVIKEVSTHHEDEDVVRIEQSKII